jgi:hypothetical protein
MVVMRNDNPQSFPTGRPSGLVVGMPYTSRDSSGDIPLIFRTTAAPNQGLKNF